MQAHEGRCLLLLLRICSVYLGMGRETRMPRFQQGLLECKRNIGDNHAFSKIIKLQFGKKCHTSLGTVL